MASTPKEDREHLQRLQRYRQAVDRIFTAAAKDAAAIGRNLKGVNTDKVFSFADYPTAKKAADALIRQLREDLVRTIESAVGDEWALSNSKNDRIVKDVYGAERWAALSAGRQESLTQANSAALQSFKARTVAGLTLSERVWKYSSRFKDEIELGLDCGIRDGLSAAAMARQLKQYLQSPDKLFRRVRNERGALVLSKRAAAYHPGQGVYRSSYKNALRLAATESNMAYRTADHERWKQLDFVVGVEIRLSNNHTLNGKPFTDICDELAGRYPKDFKFTGWHPLCRCFAVSILKTDDEIDRDERLIFAGKEPSGASVRQVDDVPDAFKAWLEANRGRIEGASSLPYFIRDNQALVDEILNSKPSILERTAARHAARTPEEIADIKERWAERAKYNEATKQPRAQGGTPFDADAYSKERKDKAIWCKSEQESMKEFGGEALALWARATPAQREAWRSYTLESWPLNMPLRGYEGTWNNFRGVGNIPLDAQNGEENIRALHQLLEGSLTTRDMWVQRGFSGKAGAQAFFGGAPLTEAGLKKLIGREFVDYAFISCSAAKGTSYSGPVILNIYCPRGTQAAFLCPKSHTVSENETLLQLGTRFRVTKVERGADGVFYVDVDVVGYAKHPLL